MASLLSNDRWYSHVADGIVSEMIKRLELVYGTMASFDILMQNFYKLQQGKTEKLTVHVTQLEGVLNTVHRSTL